MDQLQYPGTRNNMNEKDLDKKIRIKMKERQLQSMDQENYRAQTMTIGHAGGGMTEISMRGVVSGFLWNVYQPVEVVELINELAANIGCHIHIQPRKDFASWRQWNEPSEEERQHLNGFPPFVNTGALSQGVGTGLITRNKETLKLETKHEDKENDVATKKTVNKRAPKRARSSAK